MLRHATMAGYKPWDLEELTPAEWEQVMRGHEQSQETADRRVALVCASINWAHGGDAKVSDFMPRKPQTEEQIEAMAMALAKAFGGTVEKGDGKHGG